MLALGIVLFALGLLLSIAWHELGHYTAARRFGIRVPQFMVGFGPTLWSRRRGETEWGIKAIPLGGYIRMIGMIPPAPGQKVGRSRRSGPFQGMIDDIRQENNADFRPGDEDRQFWTRKPWQRIVVMFAGPFMNLILAAVLFLVVLVGFGLPTYTTTVNTVATCLVPVSARQTAEAPCPATAPRTPAYEAGVRPGDRIVSFAGRPDLSWDQLTDAIRASGGPTPMVVERDGRQRPVVANIVQNTVETQNGVLRVGYLGVEPVRIRESASPGQIVGYLGTLIGRTVQAVVTLPARVDDLFGAVFLGQERGTDTPVSVVGASVIGGKFLEREDPIADEASNMLFLLAGVNLSLFVLNLLPILPLDGGHMLPALWEATKKRFARWRGDPDPGPVDLAKLMPLAYGFALVIMSYGALVILADIVNPIKVPGL